MRAKDVMSRNVVTVFPDTSVGEAVATMLQHRISGLPVVDRAGRLVGLLTENDLVLGGSALLPLHLQLLDDLISQGDPARSLQELQRLAGLQVQDLMTREVVAAWPDTPIGELISILVTNDFKRIPIIQGAALVGIVTRADIIKVIK